MAADSALRHLPPVDQLLADPELTAARQTLGRGQLLLLAREVLAAERRRIAAAGLGAEEVAAWVAGGGPREALLARVAREAKLGVRRAVNATGVVLHTNLGRAPVHPEAAARMAEVAAGYCVLEVDRFAGRRNRRDDRVGELCGRLFGSEAAIAVNNCAAAVLLTLQSLAGGREALLSRGELVEIGGSFRMPAVMERAGVTLREVGTTNRTRLADYEAALGPHSGLLLKVHQSNYRIRGFTEEVSAAELARLGAARGVPTAYDLGSGRLHPEGAGALDFLGDEPSVEEALASGVDLVMFSGDKLLGGPQAGLILGRRAVVGTLRENPLYRALRLDKVMLAGLETTLELLLSGRADELPTRALLRREPADLEAQAQRLSAELAALGGFDTRVIEERSQPGSGSAPDVFLDTRAVAVSHPNWSAERLSAALRAGTPPVFARIQDGRLLLDPRTLLPGDETALLAAFRALACAPS